MTSRFLLLYILFFSLSFTNCVNQADQIESKDLGIMQLHDEVMPKITEMKKLEKMLKEQISGLDSTAAIKQIQALKELQEANIAMFDWMYNYKKPSAESDLNIAIQYLENQNKEIATIRDQMLSSIKNAELIINQ